MKKIKSVVAGFASLVISVTVLAESPRIMSVWLKDGNVQTFNVSEVDSVSFGFSSLQQSPDNLDSWTLPPVLNQPILLTSTSQGSEYVEAGNRFSQDCFSRLENKKGPNIFFSPISLQFALAMCANGAEPKGTLEITELLGFKEGSVTERMDNTNRYYNNVLLSLLSPRDSITFKLANALWVHEECYALEPFLTNVRSNYYTTVRKLDFEGHLKEAKDTINKWASIMTDSLINELSADINALTVLVINNAACFKGKWNRPFDRTYPGFFLAKDNEKQTVDMMRTTEIRPYKETDDYEMIELIYGRPTSQDGAQSNLNQVDYNWGGGSSTSQGGTLSNGGEGTYSMLVLLPKEGKDLNEVFDSINWTNVSLERERVELNMPKFKIKNSLSLNLPLQALGIRDIYSEYYHAVTPPPTRPIIQVSDIVQDAYVSVDEDGTEAAAVTTVVVVAGGAAFQQKTMNVNRPFGFVIREKTTGMLLFMGKVNKIEDVSEEN